MDAILFNTDLIRSVRDRDRRGWGFTVGEADRCRDGRVGLCCAIGVTVGSVRLCDRCDGVARVGSAGWARVGRERKRSKREKESREWAGVVGGGSGQ